MYVINIANIRFVIYWIYTNRMQDIFMFKRPFILTNAIVKIKHTFGYPTFIHMYKFIPQSDQINIMTSLYDIYPISPCSAKTGAGWGGGWLCVWGVWELKERGSRHYTLCPLLWICINPLGTGDLKFYQSQGLSTFGEFLFF